MNTDGSFHAPRDLRIVAACNRAIETLRSGCRSLQIAAFATDDGFEITRRPSSGAQDERLASIASSLQALTEAVARNRAIGGTTYTLIEADAGRVLLRRVPGHPIMLLAVFGAEEVAGQAISISRGVVSDLGAELSALDPQAGAPDPTDFHVTESQ
ncbi:roadblock/LC7 domain-containing protein [Leucobacter weissii]|uniref:Roadblock/LC7 domain-containing protein n=1 Tax=Leucobacter weissii TaxID=1983706 RepID=A0A939SB50_9MICO|nr:roadblock/LC7 domain-containing protein [Leucobacter weissii]MBO1901120.1 roadblock/LC7 domain-containing protein [Leucobacter weissii]